MRRRRRRRRAPARRGRGLTPYPPPPSPLCSKYGGNAAVAITRATDLSKLRVKDLKAYVMEKGIPCGECIEKADYEKAVARYFEAHPEL